MTRYGVLAMLGMLTLATPAWAGGDRSSAPSSIVMPVSNVVPASRVLPSTTTPFPVTTQPFPASRAVSAPLPSSLTAVPDNRHRLDDRHRHRPIVTTIVGAPAPQVTVVQQPVYYQTIVAAPSECVSPGYWAYRWVPYTTTQTVWVQGSWGADGTWTDSHWETRPYSSGYYDPYWVPGQPYAC
jgi:hypothetical protein